MSTHQIVFILLLAASLVTLFISLRRLYSFLRLAKPEVRWDNPGKRIIHTLKVAIGQSKIFRDKAAGPIHAGIFWGFMVFLFAASESVIKGIIGHFSWNFLGPVYTAITFSIDIFAVVIVFAVVFALLRRYVFRVARLQGDSAEVLDALIVLSAILIITVSLIFENSARTLLAIDEGWAFRPVAQAVGSLLTYEKANYIYSLFWWVHIVTILAFANYLPYSKHLHVYTSVLNVFFSKIGPVNKLEKIDFEQEGVEKFGVTDIQDMTWKNIFDSYSCTHCGRCTSVCPANLTGKELSPREIIVQIKNRTVDIGPALLKTKATPEGGEVKLSEKEQAIMGKKFVGEYQSIEALWQCTTCGACMKECPVEIEHVPAIIDMRRSLVMMEAEFPPILQNTFANLENNATPWAFSQAERADWAQGTGIQTAAEKPEFEYLYWVGCAGSYDDRAKKIALAFSRLLQIAGVDFVILGTEEQCNGDTARRLGNEYLADMMVKANVETLKNYNVKKILTTCPHCFNTFKNEYPDFGGEYEVIHHTVFLRGLIEQGKLKLKNGATAMKDITYHDSCYLGRYNNIFEAPRRTLKSIPGLNIIEPKRTGDKGLCCGAGGGQMFMEETVGKRVNIERTEELLETGAGTIALNCPFCMTMMSDGVKAKDREEVKVLDIAEILLDSVETDS